MRSPQGYKIVKKRIYNKGSITDQIASAPSEGELGGIMIWVNQNFNALGSKTLKRIIKAYEIRKAELKKESDQNAALAQLSNQS